MKTSTQTSMLVNGAIGTVGSEIVKQLSERDTDLQDKQNILESKLRKA
jgi:short-subunit dehydrogenase